MVTSWKSGCGVEGQIIQNTVLLNTILLSNFFFCFEIMTCLMKVWSHTIWYYKIFTWILLLSRNMLYITLLIFNLLFVLQRSQSQVRDVQELMDISHIQIQHCVIDFTAVMTANIKKLLVLQVNYFNIKWIYYIRFVNILIFFTRLLNTDYQHKITL